jgi:bifunctional DNA-binding transcriptional regulator/antitoxin component of YhaV-PrlF toxin-antitoxin module
MNQIVTIRQRRQITIPLPIIDHFGLNVGDKLLMKLEGEEIKIEPIKTKTVDLLSKIQEVIKKSTLSENEIQKSAKKIRKKLVASYLK